MPGEGPASELLRLFGVTRPLFIALGDERRQEIIVFLLESGAARSVGDVAARLGLSQPATSHHLKILRDASLLTVQRIGAQRRYAPNGAEYARLLAPLRDLTATIIACAAAPDHPDAASGGR
ncbi:transcriptional regulator [Spongiactinospora gelatinilytica]|uniref:Transcriptional regulator n=1 Tax=Spongiactinospora gelatinilytica TaxID=2666298 RepID=A0A2W2GQD4_9ACTN|nr:metalloregulator ArsR/SmtB family transcription factor [Spongiactinospora gelatinilytica]PZG39600.1 transcriptional regulator [Spongiactinospora gelatinilytica]